jgi:hypothetical protein
VVEIASAQRVSSPVLDALLAQGEASIADDALFDDLIFSNSAGAAPRLV